MPFGSDSEKAEIGGASVKSSARKNTSVLFIVAVSLNILNFLPVYVNCFCGL
jgi:hypothetical protein